MGSNNCPIFWAESAQESASLERAVFCIKKTHEVAHQDATWCTFAARYSTACLRRRYGLYDWSSGTILGSMLQKKR
jgi:hypothetical protein